MAGVTLRAGSERGEGQQHIHRGERLVQRAPGAAVHAEALQQLRGEPHLHRAAGYMAKGSRPRAQGNGRSLRHRHLHVFAYLNGSLHKLESFDIKGLRLVSDHEMIAASQQIYNRDSHGLFPPNSKTPT